MASKIDICNLALSELGEATIVSLGEASTEARTCNRYYEQCKEFLLKSSMWSFAKRVKPLALTTETSPQWKYVYAYPSDALTVRFLFPDISRDTNLTITDDYWPVRGLKELVRENPYETALGDNGRIILTDLCDAYIGYTQNIDDATYFPPDFVDVFSLYLAHKMTYAIVGVSGDGRALRRDLYQQYEYELAKTRANDANQQRQSRPDSDMIRAHYEI